MFQIHGRAAADGHSYLHSCRTCWNRCTVAHTVLIALLLQRLLAVMLLLVVVVVINDHTIYSQTDFCIWNEERKAPRSQKYGIVRLAIKSSRLRWFGHFDCEDDAAWVKWHITVELSRPFVVCMTLACVPFFITFIYCSNPACLGCNITINVRMYVCMPQQDSLGVHQIGYESVMRMCLG